MTGCGNRTLKLILKGPISVSRVCWHHGRIVWRNFKRPNAVHSLQPSAHRAARCATAAEGRARSADFGCTCAERNSARFAPRQSTGWRCAAGNSAAGHRVAAPVPASQLESCQHEPGQSPSATVAWQVSSFASTGPHAVECPASSASQPLVACQEPGVVPRHLPDRLLLRPPAAAITPGNAAICTATTDGP